MVGRITVMAIGAAGVVVAGLSVASATLWRPDDVLRASMTTDSPYVVTAAGVVEMGGQPTTVTVKTTDGKKAPLVVAVGRDTDVVGWVGGDPHETVSGMSGGSTLRTVGPTDGATAQPSDEAAGDGAPAEGEAAQGDAPTEFQSPAGSDMWLAEASGEGRAELKRWAPGSQYPGRWSVLVANPTEAQVSVELAWPREVSTPWLIPGLIVGLLAVGWAAYAELRRRGTLSFGQLGRFGGPGRDKGDGTPSLSSRRGVRAAQKSTQSGPVPVGDGPAPEATDEPKPEEWGTAASVAQAVADTDPVDEPAPGRVGRAQPAWSPARTWQRTRHTTEPDLSQTPTRSRPTEATPVVAPPAPVQPPPAAPDRPRTPAWTRAAAPTATRPAAAPKTRPAPSPAPAPSAPAAASGRRRAWPPAAHGPASPPEVEQPVVDSGPTTRRSPFGRSARPAPSPSPSVSSPTSSAPTLGASQSRPAPLGGWMPGRGGRTGSVPQVAAPEPADDGRRPAWLGRTRSPSTSPAPAVPQSPGPQGTAPRLSAGPQPAGPQSAAPQSASAQSDPPRGDAWRQIWGISTDDGPQEDR